MNIEIRKFAFNCKRKFMYHLPRKRPRKILFDHMPKCGGSTLNKYLEAHYPENKIFSSYGKNPKESIKVFKELTEKERYNYSLIKGHYANELKDYVNPDTLKITILRDPVERIISHYYFVKSYTGHYLHNKIIQKKISLKDYTTSNLSDELNNYYTIHYSGLTNSEVKKRPKESIEKAANVLLKQYELIGFLDEFSLFIESLRSHGNLIYQYNKQRINITENKPDIKNIPASTIENIESMNQLDIALYNKVKNIAL